MIQTKVQIEKEDYEFIKKTYKDLRYKSLSQYIRDAVNAKVKRDRRTLRELKRTAAMEMIGSAPYNSIFESLEGENFETR